MGSRILFARRHGQGNPIGSKNIILYAVLGFAVGMILGYTLMGTAHAVLEVRSVPQSQDDTTPLQASKSSPNSIHTLCTSNGSPYQNYQLRIAYATYQLIQKMPGGDRHVAFTRILHRTTPDELMDEIDTFRADPLQPACDTWCEYPVSDRANAVQQFFLAAKKDPSMIKAQWLYMIESDYVFMKPLDLPPPQHTQRGTAWVFPFGYINPQGFPRLMKRLYDGNVKDIPGTGPAPVLMKREDWEMITPDWERLAAVIESDDEMKKTLGWVREMYAFSTALAIHKLTIDIQPPPHSKFIAQLPIDTALGDAHAFHYTQCTIYKDVLQDTIVWGYDKRFYVSKENATKVPLIEVPPKYRAGQWKFIEGNPVDEKRHESITQMIVQMNKGIATLKDLSDRL